MAGTAALVAGTDMVAAVPELLARRVSGAAGVAAAGPPFGPVRTGRSRLVAPGASRPAPPSAGFAASSPVPWESRALGWRQFAPDPLDEQAHLVGDEAQVAVGRGEHGEA